MTTLLIIVAYVLNVFLNRFLNKIAYHLADCRISPLSWFCPIFPTLSLVCMILVNYFDTDNDNWFNGSRW